MAKNYLIPRILNDYHVEEEEISLNENTLKALILNYTSEAGVRDLQRKLHDIYRKIILQGMKEEQNLHVSLEEEIFSTPTPFFTNVAVKVLETSTLIVL